MHSIDCFKLQLSKGASGEAPVDNCSFLFTLQLSTGASGEAPVDNCSFLFKLQLSTGTSGEAPVDNQCFSTSPLHSIDCTAWIA